MERAKIKMFSSLKHLIWFVQFKGKNSFFTLHVYTLHCSKTRIITYQNYYAFNLEQHNNMWSCIGTYNN